MAVGKVTNATIAKLDGWMWDHKLVGFGARKQIKGVHFYVRYRIDGTQVVKSIGRLGPWTCDTARTEAKRLVDPACTPLACHLRLGPLLP